MEEHEENLIMSFNLLFISGEIFFFLYYELSRMIMRGGAGWYKLLVTAR